MKRLFLAALLCSVHAIVTTGSFDFDFHFSVSGGEGDINILEYPGDFAGQTGECGSMSFAFPPYERMVSCKVHTFKEGDHGYASYGSSTMTSATDLMASHAKELAGDKETPFEKALAIASWVRENVAYDLGVGESQEPASWVYSNGVGTCDELSHLFISLARAAGLNARYVSGYAWDGDSWLPHAWAEVWTRYGWTPVDIAFNEYGYVDGQHIVVYKGPDGDHNFILIHYVGGSSVDHGFEIATLDTGEERFISSVSARDSHGGAYSLIEMNVSNPFPTPVAFFPKVIPPEDFKMEIVWPESVLLKPGANEVRIVASIPRIPEGYIYKVPINVYLGTENASASFTVSENWDCPELVEKSPYIYDVSNCASLEGEVASTASSGRFFCGPCFYELEEPEARSYRLDYPDFCLENCTLGIEVVGSGSYSAVVNGEQRSGNADVFERIEFPVSAGNHTVVLGGVSRNLEILSPPELTLEHEFQGGRVCFSSSWNLEEECFDAACGPGSIELELRYGDARLQVSREIVRECSFFEKLVDFLLNIIRT